MLLFLALCGRPGPLIDSLRLLSQQHALLCKILPARCLLEISLYLFSFMVQKLGRKLWQWIFILAALQLHLFSLAYSFFFCAPSTFVAEQSPLFGEKYFRKTTFDFFSVWPKHNHWCYLRNLEKITSTSQKKRKHSPCSFSKPLHLILF